MSSMLTMTLEWLKIERTHRGPILDELFVWICDVRHIRKAYTHALYNWFCGKKIIFLEHNLQFVFEQSSSD